MAEKTEYKELLEFFKKKENQETILEIVRQLRSIFGREWFTFNQLKGTLKEEPEEKLITILKTLFIFKFIRSKKVKGVEHYRVSMAEIEKVFNNIEKEKKAEDVAE